MMRRKNLERAVVLGLLLSTSVYGSTWAAFWEEEENDVKINYGLGTTVEQSKVDEIVKPGQNLVIETNSVPVWYQGSLTLTNGDLKIDTTSNSGANAIASGWGKDHKLEIFAKDIYIDAGANGIFTTWGELSDIISGSGHVVIGSTDRNINDLIIKAGGQGIDNKKGSVKIYGSSESVIDIHTYGTSGKEDDIKAAIHNSGSGKNGVVYVKAGTIKLSTDDGDGINSTNGTTTLNSNNVIMNVTEDGIDNTRGIVSLNTNGTNSITAGENAVYNHGSGTITISATAGTGDEDISTLANDENYNNELVGGINGVQSDSTGTTNVIADNDNVIAGTKNGILSDGVGTITVTAGNNNIIGQYTDENGRVVTSNIGIKVTGDNGTINIKSTVGETDIYGNNGISIDGKGNEIDVTAGTNINITSSNYGIYVYNSNNNIEKNTVNLKAENDTNSIMVNAVSGNGIYAAYSSEITLSAKDNKVILNGNGSAIQSTGNGSKISLNATNVNNIQANGTLGYGSWGAYADNDGQVYLDAVSNIVLGAEAGILSQNLYNGVNSYIYVNAKENNEISSEQVAVHARNAGLVDIEAKNSNIIKSDIYGLLADVRDFGVNGKVAGEINLSAKANNIIQAGQFYKIGEDGFADGLAIVAESGGAIDVKADNTNYVYGAVYANGTGKDSEGTPIVANIVLDSAANNVYSTAVIDGAGDLDSKEKGGMDVVSALYAEEGANISLSGLNNIQTYYGDPKDEHTSERAVWAYKGANITLDGTTNISTYKYEVSPENRDIAIAAGTATELTDKDFTDTALEEVKKNLATVNLNYQAGSSISGDILAAYGGEVRITDNNPATISAARSDAATGIAITGDLLAGNTGKLTVDLGNGGRLTGRADDYGDASTEHITLYNPAFSSNIIQGGNVTLNMGDDSEWYVQGQSWITNVNTNGDVTIDLTSAQNEYQKYNSHALTIRNLNGDANIKMDLNGDRSQSDMLYIGQGNGEYNIELAELVTVDDMYAQLDDNTKFSGLRFATVGAGSDVKFNVTAKDQGFNNVIYTVDTDVYNSAESAHENDAYNGENMTEEKPGNSLVDDLLNGKQNASTESGIATLAANDVMLLADENDTENDNKTQHLNYKLVDMQSDGPTDAGKTMLNMSRANYSNAIYMDRLNKRLGEARYINDDPEEDEGMWVRIRHDRIGKEDAFRSQNTMYELGYDKRQECDNGKRRVGFAVDYMHGDTGYSDIAGKGEIDRYGLWLYDTWTGNKGHYADYVAKWGHLQNDFEVYTMTGGEKVTGDYSNNVFSISAEYGRKKDMGNDWYIEPQAQLQLARVTGADYTTSQGTKVSVDGINSLIGRAGFRLGKDFGEEKQSTVYFKADVLHEFLGDQTIRAMDGTTNGWQTVDYENKGTWYDIGIGYAAMLSQSTYAFIDLEQSFGNDNDDTYQINAGVRWTF